MLRSILLLMATTGQAPANDPPPPPANALVAPGETWRRFAEFPGWELRGVWYADGLFHYSATRKDGQPDQPIGQAMPFGVDVGRLARSAPNTYQFTGPASAAFVEKARARAEGKVQDLPDTSNAVRLTLVLPPDQAKAAAADLAGPLKADAAGLVVQSYPKGHWAMEQVGFPDGLTFQQPDGKVIYHLADYSGGPDQLKAALQTYGKARVPNPDFDLSKVPGPGSDSVPDWAKVLGVGAIAIFVLSRLSPKGNAP